MKEQLISAFLLASTFASVACGGGATTPTETTASGETTVAEVTTDSLDPQIEAVDCGGEEFTTLARETGGYTFMYNEFAVEEESGETVEDAIYRRNRYIEEKYNLTLKNEVSTSLSADVQSAVLAGDDTYDLVLPMHIDAFRLETAGILHDISGVPHIDVDKPYWMSSIVENTSVAGRNFFITGDINISTLNGVSGAYFNKKLAEELKIGDIYGLIRDGKWTFDKFSEFCKLAYMDLDGDGETDADDRYGVVASSFAWQPLYAGTDSRIIDKDSSGIPTLYWDSEKNVDIIDYIINLMSDRERSLNVNHFPEVGDLGAATYNTFREDRALFFVEIIYGVLQLRDMQSDFGILPMPKYDESQENYASYIHPNHTSTCAIPITNDNLDLAGRLLEDMAYKSSLEVRPAYYDVTLKGKISRDADSIEMLDIIYSNINLDLALVMAGMPIDSNMRNFLTQKNTDFYSTIASLKQTCEETIKTNVEAIEKIGS